MPISCNPIDLVRQAACFQCLTDKQLEWVKTYLLCEVLNSGGISSDVPSGTIVLWSGSIASIPGGWQFCDGTNGTPDLRDKFIVGARQDDSGIPKTGVTSNPLGPIVLTQSQNTVAVFTEGSIVDLSGAAGAQGVWSNNAPGLPADANENIISNYLPPYFSLAYIMKL